MFGAIAPKLRSPGREPGSIYASFPGVFSSAIGNLRWYPRRPLVLTLVRVDIGTAPVAAACVFNLRKNGIALFGANKPTIQIGANNSTPIAIRVPMSLTDYLTCDVEQAQGDSATIRIDYE